MKTEQAHISSPDNLHPLDSRCEQSLSAQTRTLLPRSAERRSWSSEEPGVLPDSRQERRLGKEPQAEIDEALIEAYRGTASLPFESCEHKRIAVKIVDDRGIESLKVIEV